MSPTRREQLLAALNEGMREQAGRTVLVHGLIAARAGLGPADVKALDLARHEADLTPGRLAEITGLTRSAVTTMLDRLEERDYVRRRRDQADRRKVTVELTGKLEEVVRGIFDAMSAEMADVLAGYTDDELDLLDGLVRRLNTTAARFLDQLRGAGPTG